ncbi:snake venom 5'-nucleotidase-like isoform X2 [Glandiceps talaboti]
MMARFIFSLFVITMFYGVTVQSVTIQQVSDTLEVTILHNNDVHSRFAENNKYGGDCSEEDKLEQKCYGGVPRIVTKVNELKGSTDNVLVLNGGDIFQGTLWFYLYEGKASSHFMNMIGYDAMAFGNHEFDNGIETLADYLNNITFPMIASNIDASGEPQIKDLFTKSVIATLPSGDEIGIVGYTTTETPDLSDTGNLVFNDEVESVRQEVNRLTAKGINKIIALGHAGINMDVRIAEEVDGVDVVVGGHTNTFLYNGEPPSNEDPSGEYPLVRHPGGDSTSGKNVLVVQDYAFGKYLGVLNVNFDAAGDVISWDGNPVLLDKTVEQDPNVLEEIEEWAAQIDKLTTEIIGKTHVFMNGHRELCRLYECNLGNIITDAMVYKNIKEPTAKGWNDVTMAIMNAGGIKSSVEVSEDGGASDITIGDVLNIIPFRDTIDLIEITGETLVKVFEQAVSEIIYEDPSGRFLQVSGIRVTYDFDRPSGERVVQLDTLCSECRVPEFRPVERERVYKLILPTHLANGGDGYTMFVDERISYEIPGDLDTDVLMEYIEAMSPITTGLENRIMHI